MRFLCDLFDSLSHESVLQLLFLDVHLVLKDYHQVLIVPHRLGQVLNLLKLTFLHQVFGSLENHINNFLLLDTSRQLDSWRQGKGGSRCLPRFEFGFAQSLGWYRLEARFLHN